MGSFTLLASVVSSSSSSCSGSSLPILARRSFNTRSLSLQRGGYFYNGITNTNNGGVAFATTCWTWKKKSAGGTIPASRGLSSSLLRPSQSLLLNNANANANKGPNYKRGPRNLATSKLHLFSSFTGDDNNNNNNSEDGSQPNNQPQQEQKILLNPTSPLSTLLTPEIISTYTLPPTTIGKDDYQTNLPKGQRIVSFGDVHGDINALRKFLITAQILDPQSTNDNPRWIGNTTICVQTGDILDRGDDELACFRLLATLSRQAQQVGGQLLLLYGNHESLNSAGLFHYANPGGNQEFERDIGARIDYNYGSNRWRLQFAGNQPSRWAAMEPGGILAENMLRNMLVSCVIGRTVFVHAGLMGSHLREYRAKVYRKDDNVDGDDEEVSFDNGISGMNYEAREWILKSHHGPNNNYGEYNTVEEVIAAAQHRAKVASKSMPDCLGGGIGASSPVWMRDYSRPNDAEPESPKAKDMIIEALKETGPDVQRMVMGHTPQYKINSALGGRAWRIDVGASQGVMGGTPEVLEIIHMGGEDGEDIVNVLTVDGKRVEGKDRAVMTNVLF